MTVDSTDRSGAALASRSTNTRASVLGANDGIVSTAGLGLGVAGATTSTTFGIGLLIGGAVD